MNRFIKLMRTYKNSEFYHDCSKRQRSNTVKFWMNVRGF